MDQLDNERTEKKRHLKLASSGLNQVLLNLTLQKAGGPFLSHFRGVGAPEKPDSAKLTSYKGRLHIIWTFPKSGGPRNHPFLLGYPYDYGLPSSTDASLSWSQVVFTGDFNCGSSDPPLQEHLGGDAGLHSGGLI